MGWCEQMGKIGGIEYGGGDGELGRWREHWWGDSDGVRYGSEHSV